MALSSGSTPPLTPHATLSPHNSPYYYHSPHTSRSPTPELTSAEERARRRAIVQPAFFYPNSGADNPAESLAKKSTNTAWGDEDEELLDPAEDPRATRGIPVFCPTLDEFSDFEAYMERIEVWGRRSGIVKVIPPKEWTDGLSSTTPRLSSIKLKSPIEQHMIGKTGLFRQQNEERRHTYSVRDWAATCNKDGLRAPAPRDVVQSELNTRRSKRARKGEDQAEDEAERAELADLVRETAGRNTSAKATPIPKNDDEFYESLDPLTHWLPPNTSAADYTPAVCRALERHYWRNCGLGKDPMYGADMQGSLFDPDMKTWNVSELPSLLTRLLPDGSKIPGVNTPYLYFGMWRATFAWHVEDMDLYSINYIHWGAPKYWYAIPSMRATAFEQTMSKHFPTEANECPQFMRHKSFLASPAILGEADCRPNTLVQHQGEFVITYPRGYHAGFNVGLNCAESVNFALDSWIEIGRRAQVCKCVGDSVHLDVDAILEQRRLRQQELEYVEGDGLATYEPMPLPPQQPAHRKRWSPPTEQPKAKRLRTAATSPPKNPSVTYATAAQLEQLPTIKIKIRPNLITQMPPAPRPRLQVSPYSARVQPTSGLLPRLKLPPLPSLPCCLCASTDSAGLLIVRDTSSRGSPGRTMPKRAHEACAQAIPETWIVDAGGDRFVHGVDEIVKDRWALKCSLCTKLQSKTHGAKIQCSKGKCPKAFHVSCAREAPDVEFTVLDRPRAPDHQQDGRLSKQTVTALCPQHNPRLVEARKTEKQQKLDADIGALAQYSRIKVRASGGVFAVTLLEVFEDRRTVEVAWDQGITKEFRYSSVVWSDQLDGAVQEKPTVTGPQRASEPTRNNSPRPLPTNIRSYHSPTPTQFMQNPRSTQMGVADSPGVLRPLAAEPNQSGTSVQAGQTPLQAQHHRSYTFQAYHPSSYTHSGYVYPPQPQVRYSHTPPFHAPATSAQGSHRSPPHPVPSSNIPPSSTNHQSTPQTVTYTVPMPMPVQYTYPYAFYGQQQGFISQPQFYPAQGYHYPPPTTYHAAVPLPASAAPLSVENVELSTAVASGVSSTSDLSVQEAGALVRPVIHSYVGVRPASSEDILKGVHQARSLSAHATDAPIPNSAASV